jgi:hypothetical protein
MSSELPEMDPVFKAVRRHLDQQAGQVDARTLLQKVRDGQKPTPRGRKVVKWAIVASFTTAIAASFAIFFVLGGGPEPRMATASELIQQAQESHATPTDRKYELLIEWEATPLRVNKIDPLFRKSTIWTRGDQFTMESINFVGDRFIWGQNKSGQIWVALNRKRGLVYEESEFGEPFIRHADMVSMRAVTLLSELLQQFELLRQDSGKPGEPIRIVANLRPQPGRPLPRFRYVELELDPETKVIRKAILKRMINGEVVNTMRFTLLETADQPEGAYELRGHLDDDGVELDGKPLPNGRPDPRARFRDEFLKRWQSKMK